ncbi:E3 ubiquitin-protein ligase FANCL isoform X2 [Amyelois transitella]|uniref:E3 ubiquitin-protein ligase FANCL isoform X2 n=1 Tax=Amyelois transitella TaxID=680683 RepID=UPI00298F91A5|nr:E3 ubiquitin-protein ligase FANCL isoform X2 [Amyelois transitella]
MDQATKIRALFEDDKYNSLSVLLNDLNSLLQYKIDKMGSVLSGIVGIEFLDEVKCTMAHEIVPIYFGKTLRDLKCIIKDDTDREHKLFFHYNGPKKLSVTKILIPHSSLENQVFSSIREMILAFKNHLNSLLNYFHQLDKIDRFCTVVEPQEINYKSEFRRILLDDRARLHIEVTSEGLANNVHLVGQFDMVNFPTTAPENVSVSTPAISKLPKKEADAQKKAGGVSKKLEEQQPMTSKESKIENAPICNICLCSDLPDKSEIPKNHCQNPFCGINFHRSCLIQWLMATSEGGSSGCGIISGKCPGCFDIIECDE